MANVMKKIIKYKYQNLGLKIVSVLIRNATLRDYGKADATNHGLPIEIIILSKFQVALGVILIRPL
jgi:hypothetical protein